MSEMFKVLVRVVKADGTPLTGGNYRVRFYDKDLVKDDLLGESRIDPTGIAEAVCSALDVRSADSPLETTPDLYCVILDGEREVARSPVLASAKPGRPSGAGQQQQLTFDLGTFAIS
jgi:hypothetical protein